MFFFFLCNNVTEIFFFCIAHYSCTIYLVSYSFAFYQTPSFKSLTNSSRVSLWIRQTFITVGRHWHKKDSDWRTKSPDVTNKGSSETCSTFSAPLPLFLPFSPSLCYWPLGLVNFFLPLVRLTLCMPLSCWEGKPSLLSYRDFAAVLD